ncbi:MAG: helix-turn-helix domain-containing protein [Armatimonadota bacterium]
MERVLTVPEVAGYLRQSPYTIRNWIKLGKIPAKKVGRGYLIHETALEKLTEPVPSKGKLSFSESMKLMRELQAETAKLGPFNCIEVLEQFDQQERTKVNNFDGISA